MNPVEQNFEHDSPFMSVAFIFIYLKKKQQILEWMVSLSLVLVMTPLWICMFITEQLY